ncbi:unnamed protein product [Moneuplotes crassus]|uniref:Uncharacterized protein n=1 Tax=Euplotes crassus TaxID=5936 RepID=A0AAD1X8V6_EUPCR|nr:unnamed protein product [Moneuplotes crassus]
MAKRRGISQRTTFHFNKQTVGKTLDGKKMNLKLDVCKPYTAKEVKERIDPQLQIKLNFFYNPYNNSVVFGKYMTFKDLYKDTDFEDPWIQSLIKKSRRLDYHRKPTLKRRGSKNISSSKNSTQMRALQSTLAKVIVKKLNKNSKSFGSDHSCMKNPNNQIQTLRKKKVRINHKLRLMSSPDIRRTKTKNHQNTRRDIEFDNFFKIGQLEDDNENTKRVDQESIFSKIPQESSSVTSGNETDLKIAVSKGKDEGAQRVKKRNLVKGLKKPRLFSPQPAKKVDKQHKRLFSADPDRRRRKVDKRQCFSALSERIKVKNREDQRNKNKINQIQGMITNFTRITTPESHTRNLKYYTVNQDGVKEKKTLCESCLKKWFS